MFDYRCNSFIFNNTLFISLASDSIGLEFNYCNYVKGSDITIKYTEGMINIQVEINKTEGVDGVYLMVPLHERGFVRGYGDPPGHWRIIQWNYKPGGIFVIALDGRVT